MRCPSRYPRVGPVHLIGLVGALLVAPLMPGCSPFVKPELPGQTPYTIAEVVFPDNLALNPKPLQQFLSVRADAFLIAGQPFNPWRQAEDRRRIAAFWKNFGYFDVVVDKADVTFDEQEKEATVRWSLTEGPQYKIRSVEVKNAPAGFESKLREQITFAVGDPVDLQNWRIRRHPMADVLRAAGHMRAEVYSRAFVDRDAKAVDWIFYVDEGPETRVGAIEVYGNKNISRDAILERAGYAPGDLLELDTVRKRELDLMDTGAFTIARIWTQVQTEFETGAVPYETWIPPDTGGNMKFDQVSPEGDYVPRALAPDVNVRVEVVEAASTQGQVIVGINMDPERIDPYVGTRLTFRNALGELNHLTFQGNVGYGLRWRGDIDEPLGVYGSARFEWLRPGTFGRIGDLRLALSFDEELFPGFHWRTAAVGLGVRTLIDTGLFLDIEPRFRWDEGVGLGTIDPDVLAGMDAAVPATTIAGEGRVSLVWDTRNDGVEALAGHLVALRAAVAPVGDVTWLRGEVDLRLFLPFNQDMGLAFKAGAGWVAGLSGDDGVPIGARLFGGGAWGNRGFGTRRLSLYGQTCKGDGALDQPCDPQAIPLGASSLFEGSVEFRWLPFRKQFGAVVFADIGGVGHAHNPFEDAVELALGLGIRARVWHLPVSLDIAYRVTDDDMFASIDALDQAMVFLRIGEAF